MLKKYLDDLEARIDPAVEDELMRQWRGYWEGECDDPIFTPMRPEPNLPKIEWPGIKINDALDDFDKMALREFATVSGMLSQPTGEVLCVRANYGTGIMPSLFGAELFKMDHSLNTLPTTRSLPNGRAGIAGMVQKGIPDLHTGLGGKTLEMGSRFKDIMKDYPNVSKYVFAYHPDMQGPLDVVELLWGSDIFLALIDDPEAVHAALDLITSTYIEFLKAWQGIFPAASDYNVHWGLLHKGTIALREDSGMNLSPEMFAEFARPYDKRLLDEFGGGIIHYCGRGDHYIHLIGETDNIYGVNLSQPEYNNMETILAHTIGKGKKILRYPVGNAQELAGMPQVSRGFVQCSAHGPNQFKMVSW